jgi:preprotein translocase subunit SecF
MATLFPERAHVEFFVRETHIDFVALRRPAYALSLVLFLLSLASLSFRGMNMGLDFTGGTLVELGFTHPVSNVELGERLQTAGFGSFNLQHFGSDRDVLVRIPPAAEVDKNRISQQIRDSLREPDGSAPEIRRVEIVGPQVGEELVEQGLLAVLYALMGIGAYIALRFERRFAIGAVIAIAHDSILTLGYFSLTGTQFDLSVLAAVLAVIGYSVNDTIVVFDRIRDNLRRMRKADPVTVVNFSINETMSRTVMTSGTTLIVVVALLLFGGVQLHGFAMALLVGIVVGTYSSVYLASSVTLDLGMNRRDVMPVDKETGKPMDDGP